MTHILHRAGRVCLATLFAATLAACGDEPAAPDDAGTPPPGPDTAATDATSDAARQELQAAYDRGLDYLAAQQEDGLWSAGGHPHIGVTGMAVAVLLERPGGVRESDRPIVDKALGHLVASLDQDGGVGGTPLPNYMTSAVIMGLAAADRPDLKPHLERAAGFLKKLQFLDVDDSSYGGIGYGSDKTRSDLSNTQYALASLRAAGIPETDPVFQRALKFLTRTQNRKENETAGEPTEWKDPESGTVLRRGNDGGAAYRPGDSKAGFEKLPDGSGRVRSYGSMTYALLRCYHLAGLTAEDGRVQAATRWISENWDLGRNPGMPDEQALEGLYYYYATVGRTLPLAGIDTIQVPEGRDVDWRAALAAELRGRQRADGSWLNENSRWLEADPGVVTCYALTALGACAR